MQTAIVMPMCEVEAILQQHIKEKMGNDVRAEIVSSQRSGEITLKIFQTGGVEYTSNF
jgi:hypothetical protein